jgi:DNA-directed RNA polymerase subunit RPC12/RpoP
MIRPHKALKALEMGGGDKMEYFFAASLAVVIIGALALTIYFTFLKSETAVAGAAKNMWKCQKCGTEFSVDDMTQRKLEEMDRPVADCPKCGSPQPVWPMVKCFNPACGKYFVRESIKNRRKSVMDDTCPYCGKNWMQGLDEQTRSRRK